MAFFFLSCFLTTSLIGYFFGLFVTSYWNNKSRPRYLLISQNIYISAFILLSCITSIYFDDSNDLLSLINYHCITFCIVASAYAYDINFLLKNKIHFLDPEIMHHIVGWIGLCYMICMEIGGGMTVRLLCDGFTTLTLQIMDKCEFGYQNKYLWMLKHLEIIFWIQFFLIRIEWYNYICIQSLLQCGHSDWNHIIFKLFVTSWWIFANIYHYIMFRDDFLPKPKVKQWFKSHLLFLTLASVFCITFWIYT